jgi:branched-chain amino acid aminotransferase
MALTPTAKVWHNGKLIPWNDAKIHIMAHVVNYGSSVFEGVRCYKTKQGAGIFRAREHAQRLIDSAKIYRMYVDFTAEDIVNGMVELCAINNTIPCYLRPLIFRGDGEVGVNPKNVPIETYIANYEWGKYLGKGNHDEGVDVCVSSWTRNAPNTMPAMAKAGANYMNSQLIKMEAVANGYVEGIALDVNGYVSEGSGENLFLVKNGTIYTPPLGNSVLGGITRDSAIRLAKDLGVPVVEQLIPREMLYICDELFFTGTAAEITPIGSVDRIPVADTKCGPITRKLQKEFFGIVTGEIEDRHNWFTAVPVKQPAVVG